MRYLITSELMRKELIMLMCRATERLIIDFDHGKLFVLLAETHDGTEQLELTAQFEGKEGIVRFDHRDLTMTIDDFSDRILAPLSNHLKPWSMEMGLWAQFAEAA